MHFKWEVTLTHETHPNTFYMGQLGIGHSLKKEKKETKKKKNEKKENKACIL